MYMTQKELSNRITLHQKWLSGEDGGEKLDLSGADLSWANLSGADLSWANLRLANLSEAKNIDSVRTDDHTAFFQCNAQKPAGISHTRTRESVLSNWKSYQMRSGHPQQAGSAAPAKRRFCVLQQ